MDFYFTEMSVIKDGFVIQLLMTLMSGTPDPKAEMTFIILDSYLNAEFGYKCTPGVRAIELGIFLPILTPSSQPQTSSAVLK